MVGVQTVVVGGVGFLFCLYYAYRVTNTVRLYRLLSGITADSAPIFVDGEPVTIEGTVTVDEEAPYSDYAIDEKTAPIAMYVWRAAFKKNSEPIVDFEERELKQSRATFASGLESGSFAITTESGDVRLDPSWLRDKHDAIKLSDVRPVGFLPSRRLIVYLWRSPYVQLGTHLSEVSLERLRYVIDDDPDIGLENDFFMSKAVSEGTRLMVHGELSIDGGTPTIRGTDETPLVVSDGGLDVVRSNLRWRAIKYGAFLVVASIIEILIILTFS